jgi:hypothetical protein
MLVAVTLPSIGKRRRLPNTRHHRIPFPTHGRKSLFPFNSIPPLPHPLIRGRMELNSTGPNLPGKGCVFWVGVEIEPTLTQFSAGTVEHNRLHLPRASICGLGASNPLSAAINRRTRFEVRLGQTSFLPD